MNKVQILSEEEIMKEYRMKKLIRYNNRNRITDEDIAQHSYFVSLFCLKIMRDLDLPCETKCNVLTKAILHDIAEIETSDLPHDVKKKYPEMNDILKKIETDYYQENWKQYENVLENNELEEVIVKIADSYSVVQYCLNERELGNESDIIKQILADSKKRVDFFTNKLNEYLERTTI